MMSSRYSIVLAVALIAATASVSTAQQTALAQEVEFIRNLATKLRFIELAQAEVQRLQKTQSGSEDFKLVAQLGIEIALIGARAHPDRGERQGLFKDSLDKSREFLERYAGDPVADNARLTMVQASVLYGEFLQEQIQLAAEEAPDKVAELEQQAAEVFREGIAICDDFLTSARSRLSSDDGELRGKYYFTWLNKGVLQRENARAVERDRVPLTSLARETFEELILEIGEESLLGLRGWFEMSKIGEVLGDYDTAVREYRDTISGIVEAMRSDEIELPPATREALFDLLQEAYDAGTRVLLQSGKSDECLAMCAEFRKALLDPMISGAEAGADAFDIASPNLGHPVFLTEAQAMAESGDPELVSKAIAQIQRINDEHPNDFVGVRAKSLLKRVTEVAGGAITGSTLFEIAKGDYQSRNYELATQGLKRAYAAMTDAERKQFGLELWNLIGRCYGVQKRFAEATLAFAKALDQHGADGEDSVTQPISESLDRAWSGYRFATKGDTDAAMRTLETRVNSLMTRFGGTDTAAKRFWKDATAAMRKREYAKAENLFSSVPADSAEYELAQSMRVAALHLANDITGARRVMSEYEKWLETPAAKIPAGDKTGMEARRGQTLAAIAYYDAALLYEEVTKKGSEDPTKYPDVIAKINSFLDVHRKLGEDYVPRAYDMRARLYCDLGEIEKAEADYRALGKEFPGHVYVPALATRIFEAHNERVKALATEHATMSAAETPDRARVEQTRDRLQKARRAALAIGIDYVQTAPEPQYGMLSTSLAIASDLRDWPSVERLGRRAMELFGENKSFKDNIERVVQPAIGESLLRQKRFREAETMLRAAVEANPRNYPLKRLLALTLGGWIEVDDSLNQIAELALEQPIEAYQIMFTEYRDYVKAKFPDYSLEWYEFMWESFLFANRAGPKDSKYAGFAKTLYSKAEAFEKFASLRKLGPQGERLYNLFLSNPPR